MVNAFQEPSSTPAQLPYKGRPSFASIVTMTARTAAVAAAVGEPPPPADSRTATGATTTTTMAAPTSAVAIQAQPGCGDVSAATAVASQTLVVIEDDPAE